MSELKKGDIVAHKSDPDICGYICEINDDGTYIVDYSISMPPNEATLDELDVIKIMPAEEKKETYGISPVHQLFKDIDTLNKFTNGFIKILTKEPIELLPGAMQIIHAWMPIESAPRDGTEILATYFHNSTQSWRRKIVWWNDEIYPWMDGSKFHWESEGASCNDRFPEDLFTHWQPMPLPPTE